MSNIFDGLEKLEDNEIVDSIAMLEAIKMGNVVKGYGTTIANKGAKLINNMGNFFGKNPGVKVVKEKRIDDYILEKKKNISNLKRNELDIRLRNVLKEKADLSGEHSDDAISTSIIDIVAKHLDINENLTYSQKADGIYRRYLEKLLVSIQKELNKQNEAEAEKTINNIDKNIENMSELDKEKLKEVLNIDDITGKEIRKVLMKAGTPALIIGTLSASGFGAYVALSTIIHAVFTTILSVTVPFAIYTGASTALSFVLGPAGIAFVAGSTIWQFSKGNKKIRNEILAQLVFRSLYACGGSITPRDEDLPSYETNEELLIKIEKRDDEYKKLVEENDILKNKTIDLENNYSKLLKVIDWYKTIIDEEKIKRNKSIEKISELKLEKDNVKNKLRELEIEMLNLKSGMNLANEEKANEEIEQLKIKNKEYEYRFEQLNDSIKYQEKIIDDASKEIEDKELKIDEIQLRNIELQEENEKLKSNIEEKERKINETEKVRRKEIEEKWKVYYPDFNITSSAIKTATKFSKKEVWEIERTLIELHSLKDYKAVSRGKVRYNGHDYEHMGFSLPSGFPTRILYRILSNSNKKVEIEKIYKHNEKFLQ